MTRYRGLVQRRRKILARHDDSMVGIGASAGKGVIIERSDPPPSALEQARILRYVKAGPDRVRVLHPAPADADGADPARHQSDQFFVSQRAGGPRADDVAVAGSPAPNHSPQTTNPCAPLTRAPSNRAQIKGTEERGSRTVRRRARRRPPASRRGSCRGRGAALPPALVARTASSMLRPASGGAASCPLLGGLCRSLSALASSRPASGSALVISRAVSLSSALWPHACWSLCF